MIVHPHPAVRGGGERNGGFKVKHWHALLIVGLVVLAVAARFVHALGYVLAVDAPEHLDDETIARRAVQALTAVTSGRVLTEK